MQSKFYDLAMKKSKTMPAAVRKFFHEITSKGGKARAKKYDAKTLSKWGAKGGRPRKKKEGAR